MALPLIQSATGTITSALSGTVAFVTPLLPNSTIVVAIVEAITSGTGDITTVSDNLGNTYTTYAGVGFAALGVKIFVAKNLKSGIPTITGNLSVSTTTAVIIAAEYGRVDQTTVLANALDPNVLGTNTGTSTTATPGTLTTANAENLNLMVAANQSSATFTALSVFRNVIAGSNGTLQAVLADRYSGIPGNKNPGLTVSSSVTWWAIQIILATTLNQLVNYQFISVGDGMSTSEKIR